MFKNLHIVLAIWFIIVGGIIIFINGDRGCINCNGIVNTIAGIISILIGIVGIASKYVNSQTVARE
jgi:hypothetical protein